MSTYDDKMLAKAFDSANLINWLETKPPEQTYDYPDGRVCLLAQYFHENGFPKAVVGSIFMSTTGDCREAISLPGHFNDISRGDQLTDWTFGKALARAKEFYKVVSLLAA